MEQHAQLTPAVGMPFTYQIGSDSYACTVVRTQGTTIVWTRDCTSHLAAGSRQSETQRYVHTDNPNGTLRKFTLRKGGAWREVGMRRSARLWLGEHHTYQDPCF